MNIRVKIFLSVIVFSVISVGSECPQCPPLFDGTYTGRVMTGRESSCELQITIQEKTGSPGSMTLNCTDPATGRVVLGLGATNGVRVMHELTFVSRDSGNASGMCSTIRIKGWPETLCPCPASHCYYERIVGAIDQCASNPEAGIESVCIPYMGVSAQMVAKGGGEDQE
jgi:hypothetical protein